jgi:hypothetical protein
MFRKNHWNFYLMTLTGLLSGELYVLLSNNIPTYGMDGNSKADLIVDFGPSLGIYACPPHSQVKGMKLYARQSKGSLNLLAIE